MEDRNYVIDRISSGPKIERVASVQGLVPVPGGNSGILNYLIKVSFRQ
jgi:hypothetical protein